jgi:anti-sigma factor RsiW
VIRARHLRDERLYDCYIAERTGDSVDPPAAEHLFECPRCSARFSELGQFMDTIRSEGDAYADAVFTPERLSEQYQAIVQRIEHLGRPARVISFPGRVTRHVVGATTRFTPRWLAAAAAAGLFIGVAVGGMFFDTGSWVSRTPSMMARSKPERTEVAAPPVRASRPAPLVESADDDQFLSELEQALQNPHVRELMPLDALTPHVRDISTRLR